MPAADATPTARPIVGLMLGDGTGIGAEIVAKLMAAKLGAARKSNAF